MEGIFRKPRAIKRIIKHRTVEINDDEDFNDEETCSRIQDVIEIQQSRQRVKGMNALECAVGKDMAKEFNKQDECPFNMRGGGMLRLNNRKAALNAVDIENDIKEQFKKETLLRDEHEEMKRYIEKKITKSDTQQTDKKRPRMIEDEILFKAAEKVKKQNSKTNDELLSNQMLVGIPEVDLGIEVRMRNIIETEQKKMEILQNR